MHVRPGIAACPWLATGPGRGWLSDVRPMLATAGALPAGPGWAYELKWDGVRVLADAGPDRFVLTSRSGRDVTMTYPELGGLADACPDALFDGEVVAFVDGRPTFTALQPRMHVREVRKARALQKTIPVTYLIFDVLRLYGVDLTGRPYAERRETLERLDLDVPHCTVPPVFDDGPATVAACEAQNLEGVVAKSLSSRYHPGHRSPEWIKVRTSHRQEFIVCGWQRGSGGRTDQIGSLVLGYHDENGALLYAGQVGTGFTAPMLRTVQEMLEPLRRDGSPFDEELPAPDRKDVLWCDPEVVVMVEFLEWTPSGRLRFPSFQGVRNDKDPREVVRE